MPKFCSLIASAFRSVDLFPSSKLVRYNGETEYTSTTGGIISVAVIAVFVALFASMALKTLRKEIITAEVTNQFQINPTELRVKTNQEDGWQFGVLVAGLNLSSSPRYFDVTLYEEHYTTGYVLQNQTQVTMETCTADHFGYTEEMRNNFNSWGMSMALCPPLGHQFLLRGSVTSNLYSQFRLVVDRCNATADATCISDSIFAARQAYMGKFQVAVPMMGNNINAQSEVYRQFYLDDKNYFSFSSTLGTISTAYLQEDIIETDISLMPYSQTTSQTVKHIPELFFHGLNTITSVIPMMQVTFKKAPKSIKYYRSFNKIDAYLSYVGGLVGTIIGLIFIMGPFTQKAYELSLAKKVMLDNDKEEIQSNSFHLGYFLMMYLKGFLEFIKIKPNWTKTQKYIETSEEMCMQLDTTYMVRKLMFLDAAVAKILEKHEIEAICMRQRPTLEKAKDFRRLHFAPQVLKQENQEQENEEGGSSSQSPKDLLGKQVISPGQHSGYDKKDEIIDVSQIGFSRRVIEQKNRKEALKRVTRQSLDGRSISKDILDELDPQLVKMIMGAVLNKQERSRSSIKVEDIHANSVFYVLKEQNQGKKKEDSEEFK